MAAAWILGAHAAPAQEQDSSAIQQAALKRARGAQAEFERIRRAKLPPTPDGVGSRCDERVGRFCYWYDESDQLPPEEFPVVRVLRAGLIAALDSAVRLAPSSEWIVGQQVRYRVEQGDSAGALAVLDSCRVDAWWCAALRGYALHAAERFADANAAFDGAVAAMPADQACEWLDLGLYLDGSLADQYDRTPCSERAALTDSLLWLGQPFLSRSGNDLRSELLSRRVLERLLARASTPHGTLWGDDAAELMLRYGWPVRWSVARTPYPTLETNSVVGQERQPAYPMFPLRRQRDSTVEWSWPLIRDHPRSRFSPTYLTALRELPEPQVGRFRRGDSVLVVAAFELGNDTVLAGRVDSATLAVSLGPGGPAFRAPAPLQLGVARLALAVPEGTGMLGLEVAARDGARFGRWRQWLDSLPSRDGSDLVFFEPGDSLPAILEDVVSRLLPSMTVSRRRGVGVFWETYRTVSDSLPLSISAIPDRPGVLGRVATSLKLASRRAPLTIRWQAPPGATPSVGRAIELDLSELKPGGYRIRVETSRPDGTSYLTERRIRLVK